MVIKLDDGRFIQFPGDSLKDLQHSYAATVHMAQGSEYKDVMLVMTPGQASFMNANMFLTGASRAREGLWIYGDDAELRRIAATKLPPGTRRWWSASTRSSPRRSATSTTPARKGIGPRAEQTMAAHAQIAVRTAYDPAATNGFAVLGASISEGRLAALIARDRFVEVVNQDGVRLQLSFDLNRETLVCERLAPDAAPLVDRVTGMSVSLARYPTFDITFAQQESGASRAAYDDLIGPNIAAVMARVGWRYDGRCCA